MTKSLYSHLLAAMKKPPSPTLAILCLTVVILAVTTRYPGVINFKLLGSELLIDGRQIEIPRPAQKYLDREK
jgi:hypothetical protein